MISFKNIPINNFFLKTYIAVLKLGPTLKQPSFLKIILRMIYARYD